MKINSIPGDIKTFIQSQQRQDSILRLNTGDTVKASVVEAKGEELTLKLSDGSIFTAKFSGTDTYSKGETAEFRIINIENDTFVLEKVTLDHVATPKSDLSQKLPTLLDALDLPVNEKNIQIATYLSENSIPLTRSNVESVLDIITAFGNVEIREAAAAVANNIQPDEKILAVIKNIFEGNFNLNGEIEELKIQVESLTGLDASKFEGEDKSIDPAFLKASNEFIKNIDSSFKAEGQKIEFITKLEELTKNVENATPQKVVAFIKENIPEFQNMPVQAQKQIAQFILNAVKADNGRDDTVFTKPEIFQEAVDITEKALKFEIKDQLKITDILKNIVYKEEAVKADMPVANNPANVNIDREALAKTLDGLYVKITQDFNSTASENINLLKDSIKNVIRNIDELKRLITSSDLPEQVKQTIVEKADNILTTVRTANDLTHNFIYMQLPLMTENGAVKGELYILKKEKGKKKINPENTTLLLSLDTVYAGRVDSLITVNKKTVSLNIRVENDRLIQIVNENHHWLYDRFLEKNYKLGDLKCRRNFEKPKPVTVEKVIRDDFLPKYTVDIRL